MIRQVRGRLHHAPSVARGAHASAFAGLGDEAVMSTIVRPRLGKAVGKDAAHQILAKRLAHIGLGGGVVALAVDLVGTGQLKLGSDVFGDGLVQQRALRVARVVKFGFTCWCGWDRSRRATTCMVVRMRLCVQRGCRRVHGAKDI